jgi:hypothetical protein
LECRGSGIRAADAKSVRQFEELQSGRVRRCVLVEGMRVGGRDACWWKGVGMRVEGGER